MTVKWARDTRLETFLKKLHVKFKWERGVPLAKIDFGESLNRQTRFGKKLDDLMVNAYGVQMLDGAEFPGIMINRPSKNFSYITSGLHRGHAAKDIREEVVDCYVTEETDDRLLDMISRTVNALEGRRPDREELIQNALYLCDVRNLAPKDVCAWFGLKPEHITVAKRQQEIANAIREEGLNPDGISKSLLIKMSPVADNRNVLRHLSRLVKQEGVGFSEAERIIEDVKAGTTEAERIQVIRDWKEAVEARTDTKLAAVVNTSSRTTFWRLLTGLDRFLANIERAEQLQLNEQDRIDVPETWERVAARMRALINERVGSNGRK